MGDIMADVGAREESPLLRAERVYAAAADHFTRPALGFWDACGAETVRRAGVGAGESVLDLCCGAGASVVPAAHAVGPSGRVVGVDIADPLLALARDRVVREGLANTDLQRVDATATGFGDASFDCVVCVFGVFFVADMPAFVSEMWRMVSPGGRLAITTWGPGWLEPAGSIFWEHVRQVRPELHKAFNPWDEITSPAALTGLLAAGGVTGADAVPVAGRQRLDRPEDFWEIVLGSGLRATVDALDDAERAAVRSAVLDARGRADVAEVGTDSVIAIAAKPST
jgi:ubiquinone/menaquinone biosynthesis C-methylase UbiE